MNRRSDSYFQLQHAAIVLTPYVSFPTIIQEKNRYMLLQIGPSSMYYTFCFETMLGGIEATFLLRPRILGVTRIIMFFPL